MNKLTIIGNLTRDPELRTTATGLSVCSFTVAVNRRKKDQNAQAEADFFKVTAWRERGETCAKYLTKGSKVCVIGSVSVSTFTGNDGTTRASLDVTADEVEFLSAKNENAAPQATAQPAPQANPAVPAGFTQVSMDDELPF